jgi:hypothetical protein
VVVTTVGCVGAGDAGREPVSGRQRAIVPGDGIVYDEEPNGRFVLGAILDKDPYTPAGASEYFSVGAVATRRGRPERVALRGAASLVSVGDDGWIGGADHRFDGLGFVAGTSRVTLTVVGGDADITHYALDVQDLTAGGVATRVCDDAIPIAGVIDRSGKHLPTPGRFTLACKDGAAQKCTVWGYPAGPPGGPLWGAHEACMQMVTADYCADGATTTRTGTSIRFYDNVGVNQIPSSVHLPMISADEWPPSTSDYYFESAFTGVHTPAVCLGKLRWPLLADGCAATLPDCAGGTVDGLIDAHGAVLFVASKYNQLRLDRWQRSGDGRVDRVATVRGYYNVGDQVLTRPWDGYAFDAHEGVLLRVPPDSVGADELHEVSLFHDELTNDRFVARSDDARFAHAPFARDGFEGYVYQAPTSGLVALRLYRRDAGGAVERLSSTQSPAELADLGYVPDLDASGSALIGWIAPAP